MKSTEATSIDAVVGDIVLCRDAQDRENLKLPNELGLVIDVRKDRAKVFFPSVGGEPWLPVALLARVRDPATSAGVPPWMQRAWFLARTLEAMFMEVAHVGADGCALRVFHGEIDATQIDAARAGLGDELRYCTLSPAGMHKIEASLAFTLRDGKIPPLPPPPRARE